MTIQGRDLCLNNAETCSTRAQWSGDAAAEQKELSTYRREYERNKSRKCIKKRGVFECWNSTVGGKIDV